MLQAFGFCALFEGFWGGVFLGCCCFGFGVVFFFFEVSLISPAQRIIAGILK